jgi:hypothetical protein
MNKQRLQVRLCGGIRLHKLRGPIPVQQQFSAEPVALTFGRLKNLLRCSYYVTALLTLRTHSSQDMRPLLALVLVAWWIALWGLFETYTEHLDRQTRLRLYWSILVIVTVLCLLFPKVNRIF